MNPPRSFPHAVLIPPGFWEVAIEDLPPREEVRVIDIREAPELAMIPLIEGAEHHPMSTIGEVLHQWDRDEAIVVLCAAGVRSARVVLYMISVGFTNAVSLGGGIYELAAHSEAP